MTRDILERLIIENNTEMIADIADMRAAVEAAPPDLKAQLARTLLAMIGDELDDVAPEARVYFERYAPPPTPPPPAATE